MSNPWFRLYSEIIDDEKLLMLAFQDRWHYVAILCLKNKGVLDQEADGSKLNRKVAAKLGITPSEAEELKRRLADEGLIDSVSWQPTGWDRRQYKSDSSAERVRQHRIRKRECNVTSNVTETPPDTETDTESERLQGSESVLVSAHEEHTHRPPAEVQPIPIARGYSRFPPDDFTPDEAFFLIHRGRNPNADYDTELARFMSHEFVNGKTDWQRAWVSWWIRAKPKPVTDPQGRISPKTVQTMQNLQEYIRG